MTHAAPRNVAYLIAFSSKHTSYCVLQSSKNIVQTYVFAWWNINARNLRVLTNIMIFIADDAFNGHGIWSVGSLSFFQKIYWTQKYLFVFQRRMICSVNSHIYREHNSLWHSPSQMFNWIKMKTYKKIAYKIHHNGIVFRFGFNFMRPLHCLIYNININKNELRANALTKLRLSQRNRNIEANTTMQWI